MKSKSIVFRQVLNNGRTCRQTTSDEVYDAVDASQPKFRACMPSREGLR